MRWGTDRPVGRALLAACAAILLTIAALSPLARADGDPASDVLLGQNVFYPYQPPVSASLQKSLNAETAAAAHAHFPIKVALIDSQFDLGVVPTLFNKPQPYAKFLEQELRLILGPHVALLVVMPAGYGVEGLPAADAAVAAGLPKPAGTQSNDLAQAAVGAVRKLAGAAGHPIANSSEAGGGGGGGSHTTTIVVVALAAIALAGAILLTRRRLSSTRARARP
jgi:hypothetical protein